MGPNQAADDPRRHDPHVAATDAELARLGTPLSKVIRYENGIQVPGR